MILTKNLEIYIIELPKFEKYAQGNKELDAWVKFIRNPEVINMSDVENNEALEKAKKVLDTISEDEREQELAFQRLMYIMDKKAIEAAGFDKGKAEGRTEGRSEGIRLEKENIAKRMLKQNVDINTIITCTGLTEEEIKKLM